MEKILYNRIKVVLTEKNVTNKRLAQMLNVQPVTVSHWCTNDCQPSIPMLFEIAGSLEVDVKSLIHETPRQASNLKKRHHL